MRVLIVGAGVGGLAAARALGADGHRVIVFERAQGTRRAGAAVTLWSNGTGVLADLGVRLDGVGARIDALEQRTADGRLLLRVDVARSAARYGHPHLCLPRRRLLELMGNGLPAGTVQFGRRAVAVHEDADGARVEFEDGGAERGDLVIGADGRSSVVRERVWGRDPAEPSGWATWQGVSPIAVEVTSSRRGLMVVGPQGLCGLMPAGEGLLQWWFDVCVSPGEPPPAAPVAMLRERFGGWGGQVREVLAAVDDAQVGFFPHVRHRVPAVWSAGRMTLVGDAAHSMPPTRAQGANQALEDAWMLARAVREAAGDVPAALRAYERERAPKAGLVARQAGTEDTNEYRPWMTRMVPNALASRYHERWLRQISTFLTA